MTKNDIVKMAKKVGLPTWYQDNALANESLIVEFAELVAAAEREACAVIAFNAKTYLEAAAAIRARGQV